MVGDFGLDRLGDGVRIEGDISSRRPGGFGRRMTGGRKEGRLLACRVARHGGSNLGRGWW